LQNSAASAAKRTVVSVPDRIPLPTWTVRQLLLCVRQALLEVCFLDRAEYFPGPHIAEGAFFAGAVKLENSSIPKFLEMPQCAASKQRVHSARASVEAILIGRRPVDR
jgi:hypothetical protein